LRSHILKAVVLPGWVLNHFWLSWYDWRNS